MSDTIITCFICNKKELSNKSFHRWNVSFCSKKCHDIEFNKRKEIMEEEEEKIKKY